MIEAAQEHIPDNRTYANNERAHCIPDPGPAHNVDGKIFPNAALCVWPEWVGPSEGLGGKRIKELMRVLLEKKNCMQCGHISVTFVPGHPDKTTGEVTVGVVPDINVIGDNG